ncbi:hypothetical protein A33K_18901 [Burkholderia humptydooensis MSMB43]|uniref:Uncharacterized protein n=1 Tax=Burkholderia humptydooensis MSMB43 TaxID=441157 RepID=A0ABN0FX44_9BURK|nr:hypothetical protein A33K_18901 [Burkholderia humptydooensis MSMB43]
MIRAKGARRSGVAPHAGEQLPELFPRVTRLRDAQRRIADDDARGQRRARAERVQRLEREAGFCRIRDERAFVDSVSEPQHEMKSGMLAGNRVLAVRVPAKLLEHRIAALQVRVAARPQMLREIAAADEARQRELLRGADRAPDGLRERRHRRAQRRRHDHEAHANSRKKRLVERAAVDHAIAHVERFQRRQRRGLIAEFAVVVVLDHPRAPRMRPVEQVETPRDRHRHAERRLMRGRHIRGRDTAMRAQRVRVDAFRVDRNADRFGAGQLENSPRGSIAGILDRDPALVAGDRAGNQIDRMPDASRDEDVGRAARDAAILAEIVGNPRAQRLGALRR